MGDSTRSCSKLPTPRDIPIKDLDTDQIDQAFLSASRFFFLSFAESDSSAWLTAILGSQCFFHGPGSAEIMRRALAVVHEMRTSRRSMFRFSNPRCAGCSSIVTQDERYLLQMIQAARRGESSKTASMAMLLCEGNPTDAVIGAAMGFCALVGTGGMLEPVE